MSTQNKVYDVDIEADVLYQVERLKEDYDELDENYRLVQKELKSRTRQHEASKRDNKDLEQRLTLQREQFEQMLKIQEEQNSKLLTNTQHLEEELERYKQLLEEAEKARVEILSKQVPVADDVSAMRETNKQTREYHYKWKMAEQENSVLQTAVNRLENQVARYKESLKEAETVEGDLKAEKRKLLRELRESQAKVEELETNNTHLQKRLDRIKSRNLLIGGDSVNLTSNNTPNSSLNIIPSRSATDSNTQLNKE